MSKEAWFVQFERLEAERDAGEIDATDEQLSDMAHDAMVDRMAEQADRLSDEAKYEGDV